MHRGIELTVRSSWNSNCSRKMGIASVNDSNLAERLRIVISHLRTLHPQGHGITDAQLGHLKHAIGKLRSVADAGQNERKRVVTRIRELAPRLRKLLLELAREELKPYKSILMAFAADLKPDGRGIPLAALSVSELGTSEVKFTQLIRYFLDPKAPHGLGASILQSLIKWGQTELEKEQQKQTIPLLNFDSAKVEAEVPLGTIILASQKRKPYNPRIDLVVYFPNFVILIEQKINSDESVSRAELENQLEEPQQAGEHLVLEGDCTQLHAYWEATKHNWEKITKDGTGKNKSEISKIDENNSLRIFLTPTGKGGKRKNDKWFSLSHEGFVNSILDESRRVDSQLYQRLLSNRARHNLACFLWDFMQGPVMRDQTMLKKLEERIDAVVSDPASYFGLRRWCEAEQIDWQVLIKLMEVDYAE